MPSYIEIDKQGSFPASSNTGKLIFGFDTTNQAVITDSLGNTTTIGGGSGIQIPTPIPYSERSVNYSALNGNSHYRNEPLPSPISNSWDEAQLCLTYQSNDTTFLNYNPKYFLFVYRSKITANKQVVGRHTNNKRNKSFIHPPNYSYDWGTNTLTDESTYKNFSKANDNEFTFFSDPFNSFKSEWSVQNDIGKQTILTGFNPLRFYCNDAGSRGQEFFPLSYDDRFTRSITTVKKPKRFPNYVTSPRLNLYVRFAIVINNPNNPNNYVIGPFSETIKIFPIMGYFNDGSLDQKYYYAWGIKRA